MSSYLILMPAQTSYLVAFVLHALHQCLEFSLQVIPQPRVTAITLCYLPGQLAVLTGNRNVSDILYKLWKMYINRKMLWPNNTNVPCLMIETVKITNAMKMLRDQFEHTISDSRTL